MASETRQFPRSNVKIEEALVAGKEKNDLEGAGSWITVGTKTRIDIIEPKYVLDSKNVVKAQQISTEKTAANLSDEETGRRVCSDFIQVFYLATGRGTFKKTDLGYYDINSNGNVPEMNTVAQIKAVAKRLIKGEADRVADGGAPMSMPPISEVASALSDINTAAAELNVATEDLKTKKHTLNDNNLEAMSVIKLLWAEVEAHYVTLTASEMRAMCRLWGIKYAKVGSDKNASGKVLESISMLPIIGADVSFLNGNNDDVSTDTGYSLDTTLMDVQPLTATCAGYMRFSADVTLIENENLVYDIIMVKII